MSVLDIDILTRPTYEENGRPKIEWVSTSHYSAMGNGDDIASIFRPICYSYTPNLVNRVVAFSKLPDNWDGYGAITPDELVINNSKRFILHLPESVVEELTIEDIGITPYGTITFDWGKNDNLISVEIGEKKIGFFSRLKNGENYRIDEYPFNEYALPSELDSAFKSFFQQDIH